MFYFYIKFELHGTFRTKTKLYRNTLLIYYCSKVSQLALSCDKIPGGKWIHRLDDDSIMC